MKTSRLKAALVLLLTSSSAFSAPSENWINNLKKKLQPLGTKASLSIETLDGGSVFNLNENQPMVPASIAKVISTACSLESLTPGFRYKTEFLTRGILKDGELSSSLIVKGSGDPSFVIEDLREQVARMRELYKIKTLNGALEIDVSFLKNGRMAIAEAFEGDNGRAFTADLTSLIFNYNSFGIWVGAEPGGQKAVVEILPYHALPLKLNSSGVKIRSGNPGPGNASVSYEPKTRSVVVSGTFGPEALPKAVYRAAPDPYEYFYETLRSLWIESGGVWNNPKFKLVESSKGASLLTRHESRALSSLVRDINKNSLNPSAEMILLTAGAEKHGWPATREKAQQVLKACLKTFGTTGADIQLDNASGLSRTSKIKTAAFTQFIQKYLRAGSAPDFLASLPVIGQDGTMRDRLKSYEGRGRVKTGTMSNVGSIAGVVQDSKGTAMVFTFVINGMPGNGADAHRYQNIVLEAMLQL